MVKLPQRPDLSIMKAVWDYREGKKDRWSLKKEEIWQVLQDAWNNQPVKYFEKLWEVDMFEGKVAQTKKRCDSTFTF